MAELKKYLPEKKNLRILDVGCGTGFFTILLAKEGHQVTGIDLTPDMITHAKELAEEEKADCRFMVMDAEAPDFPDEEFDVIVSRNLTWTLPDAEHAYQEWFRVLKPGGHLVILELTTPDRFPMKQLFSIYSKAVIPLLGKLLSKDNSAYRYLPDTIKVFPQGEIMKGVISRAGFSEVNFRRLTFGICTLYTATK